MRSSSRLSRIALFFLFMTALAARAAAQAKVVGTVVDESGKTIRAATVTAENANLGQTFTASTDDKGRFTMIGLRPGQWRMIASAPGYLAEAGTVQLRSGNNANPPMTIAIRRNGVGMGPLGSMSAKDLQSDLAAADALFNQKRWDEAVVAYRAVLVKAPSISAINLQIAAAYRGKGDFDAAIVIYRDLLRVDATNEKARIGIGIANTEKGDMSAAEAALTQAAENPTAGRESFYTLGDLKFAKGEIAEAMKWYQKATAADPSWGKPLYKLGLGAIAQGDKAAAANYMTRALAVDPGSPEAGLAKTAIDQLNK
jgi:tetratricopeptide (TPR) repeat protein